MCARPISGLSSSCPVRVAGIRVAEALAPELEFPEGVGKSRGQSPLALDRVPPSRFSNQICPEVFGSLCSRNRQPRSSRKCTQDSSKEPVTTDPSPEITRPSRRNLRYSS